MAAAAVCAATVPAGCAAVDVADVTAAGRDTAKAAAARALERGAARQSCNDTVSLSPPPSHVIFSAQPRRHDDDRQYTTPHYNTLHHTTIHSNTQQYTATATGAIIIINIAHEQSRICIGKDIV